MFACNGAEMRYPRRPQMFACNGAGLRSGMNPVLITGETGFAKRDIRGGLLCSHATALGFGQG